MANGNTQYEYGLTPEETAPGILGFFNFLRGPVVDAFTPERREVITPSKTTYTEVDGMYRPTTTPGVYGPAERGIQYMPVVQGAKSTYEFLENLISSGKAREEASEAFVKGIGTLLEDQRRAAFNAGLGGDLQFYDPEQRRVVGYDPLLVPTLGAVGAAAAPVKAVQLLACLQAAGHPTQIWTLLKQLKRWRTRATLAMKYWIRLVGSVLMTEMANPWESGSLRYLTKPPLLFRTLPL